MTTVYYKCPLCDFKTKILHALKGHFRRKHNTHITKCPICGSPVKRLASHCLTHSLISIKHNKPDYEHLALYYLTYHPHANKKQYKKLKKLAAEAADKIFKLNSSGGDENDSA